MMALVLLAFSAVAREGFETVIFLFAGSTNATSTVEFWVGGILGFLIAGVVGVVLYYGAARLPLRQFFLLSGAAVIILAAGLLVNGLAELHEGAVISDMGSRPWDTEAYLPMTSTLGKFMHTVLGYDSAPTWGQIIAYWTYITVVLGAYLFWPVKREQQTMAVAGATPRAYASAEKPLAETTTV